MLYMSFAPSTTTFLISVLIGLFFGAIWDCFRIIRKKIGNLKKLIFILDLLYFILVSICTICFFFFFTSGGIRAFALIGELLGFVLFYSTFEKPVFPLINFIISTLFRLLYSIYKISKFSFLKLTNFFEKVLINTLDKTSQKIKAGRSFHFKNGFFKNLSLRKFRNDSKNKKK